MTVIFQDWQDLATPAGGDRQLSSGSSTYDATTATTKRQQTGGQLMAEDRHLDTSRRRRLQAESRDVQRNYSVAGWAIRKHLDFVASHTLHITGPDRGLVRDVEQLWQQEDETIDRQGRLDLPDIIRLAEARATVDGDLGLATLASGQLQGLESDRIRNPGPNAPGNIRRLPWDHGVLTDKGGRATAFCVHRRGPNGRGYEFERLIRARNLVLHGPFDRFDQTRGISPLAAGLLQLRDSYETIDLAIAKAKVSNLFGMCVYRDGDDSAGQVNEEQGSENDDGRKRYQVDFGRGPVFLDLDPGERAEFLHTAGPGIDHQAFVLLVIRLAIASLDLPLVFWDESRANYSSSRGALLLYLKSCRAKRRRVRRTLRRIQRWKMAGFIARGDLIFPRTSDPRDLVLEWVPDGMPWWDPAKETKADLDAVKGGLRTRAEIRRERFGDDWRRNVAEPLAEEERLLRELGVSVEYPAGQPVQPTDDDDDETERGQQ